MDFFLLKNEPVWQQASLSLKYKSIKNDPE